MRCQPVACDEVTESRYGDQEHDGKYANRDHEFDEAEAALAILHAAATGRRESIIGHGEGAGGLPSLPIVTYSARWNNLEA